MLVPGGVPEVERVSVGEAGDDGKVVRVLVVDDQAPFRRAMRSVVEETDGFEVVGEVDSGEASLEAAAALAPHLVLMDVHLPGIDGLEATRRLAAMIAWSIASLESNSCLRSISVRSFSAASRSCGRASSATLTASAIGG